jgi:hypothetical protein
MISGLSNADGGNHRQCTGKQGDGYQKNGDGNIINSPHSASEVCPFGGDNCCMFACAVVTGFHQTALRMKTVQNGTLTEYADIIHDEAYSLSKFV